MQWDGDIVVPFAVEAPLSGVAKSVSPEQRLWYQRHFKLSSVLEQRTLLHFGAVDYECVVWINGAIAGTHTGGFDAFSLDITMFVEEGENNILIAVSDPTSSGDQPRGKQHLKPQGIWYTAVTGIWQTVWLEQVPMQAHIEELVITPTLECDAIEFAAMLYRPSRNPALLVKVDIHFNNQLVTSVTTRTDRKVTIDIPNPQLWSPETPNLYDVEVRLFEGVSPLPTENDQAAHAQLLRKVPLRGATEANLYAKADLSAASEIDQVTSYFGLRSIQLGRHPDTGLPTLLLNQQPVFHFGPLDQGWWPDGLHTPPADAAIVYELEYLKSAGFNTVRKHIKIEPQRYYYHCDRIGLLVWQDMPSGFLPAQFVAPNDQSEGLRSSRATTQFELALQHMVYQLHPHPCVVMWVLHNEGWGQFDTQRLTRRLQDLDPSRLINAVSGWLDVGAGDVVDQHDYNTLPGPPKSDGHRATVLGEYGGIGWPIENHLWNPDIRNWGYQTLHEEQSVLAAYTALTEQLIKLKVSSGLAGAIYTQTTDVEGEVNGLLTYDRKVEKFPPEWLRELHRPLHKMR